MMRPLLSLVPFLVAVAPALLAEGIPEHLKATRVLAFEGVPAMGWGEFEYRFTASDNGWVRIDQGEAIMANNGTRYLEGIDPGISLSLEHADGLEFDLMELDLAEFNSLEAPDPVRFEGSKRDGTLLVLDVPLDGVSDGDGPGEDFQKVVFPPEWTGVVKVRILGELWAIDNIKVRGAVVEAVHEARGDLPVPLEVLGTLATNATSLFWRVGEFKGSKLVVHERNFSLNRTRMGLFDPATGQTTNLQRAEDDQCGNPLTGEFCWVTADGRLLLGPAAPVRELARVGQNGVTSISYPAVSNGKVIFADVGYQSAHGEFAAFMASSTGVVPVLTPTTVLADGGTPARRPNAMHFTGNTYAIPSSTTKTGDCFLVSFNGGPIRVSPSVGKMVPGTNFIIQQRDTLLWLDDNSIGYLVQSGSSANPRDHVITMLADGSSSSVTWDPLFARYIVPGSGMVQRSYGAAGLDRGTGTILIAGPLECRDVAPNNLDGIVARSPDGITRVLVREGSILPGFGELKQFHPNVTAANGEFFFTARNEAGTVAVLKGRIPESVPQFRTGDFIPTADGTVRFMVENLTHGLSYRVESAPGPAGPWSECSRFTGGSRSRSVFGAFERGTRGFFRVVEE